MTAQQGLRVLCLWFPDWPVLAAQLSVRADPRQPAAVLPGGGQGGLKALNTPARQRGLTRGMLQRHAQALCPEIVLYDDDPAREAAFFEPVLEGVSAVAAGCDVLRPGLVAVPAKAVSGYYGSEDAAASVLLTAAQLPGVDCVIGVADGLEQAVLAARQGQLIPPGRQAAVLAAAPVSILAGEVALGYGQERQEIVATLQDVGIRTVGQVAAFPRARMEERFGAQGVALHQLACGESTRRLAQVEHRAPIVVEHHAAEVLTRTDEAAFIGRGLAAQLHAQLVERSVACTRLRIGARLSTGQSVERTWQCIQPLTPESTAQRVRWQLEGWLLGMAQAGEEPTEVDYEDEPAGIVVLWLEPVELIRAEALQQDLFAAGSGDRHKAQEAAARVQALLGPDAVVGVHASGGLGPGEQVVAVPFGDEPPAVPQQPWVGAVPGPHPARLIGVSPGVAPEESRWGVFHSARSIDAHHPAARIQLVDAAGQPVVMTPRLLLSAPPVGAAWGTRRLRVLAWAGPWVSADGWWEGQGKCARLQLVVDDAQALVVIFHQGHWRVEGIYD